MSMDFFLMKIEHVSLNPQSSWTFYGHIFGFMPISVSHVKSAIFELNCGEICQKTGFFLDVH